MKWALFLMMMCYYCWHINNYTLSSDCSVADVVGHGQIYWRGINARRCHKFITCLQKGQQTVAHLFIYVCMLQESVCFCTHLLLIISIIIMVIESICVWILQQCHVSLLAVIGTAGFSQAVSVNCCAVNCWFWFAETPACRWCRQRVWWEW